MAKKGSIPKNKKSEGSVTDELRVKEVKVVVNPEATIVAMTNGKGQTMHGCTWDAFDPKTGDQYQIGIGPSGLMILRTKKGEETDVESGNSGEQFAESTPFNAADGELLPRVGDVVEDKESKTDNDESEDEGSGNSNEGSK